MKKAVLLCLLICLSVLLAGCGETVSGVQKDTTRMGKGLSTFFFRQ